MKKILIILFFVLFSCQNEKYIQSNTHNFNAFSIQIPENQKFLSEKIIDPINTIFYGTNHIIPNDIFLPDFETNFIFKNDNHPIAKFHISCDEWLDNEGVTRAIKNLPNGESLHLIFSNCENQTFPESLKNPILNRQSFVIDFGNFHFSAEKDFEFLSKIPAYQVIFATQLTLKNANILRNSEIRKIFTIKQEGTYNHQLFTFSEKVFCKNIASKNQDFWSEQYSHCLMQLPNINNMHNETSLPDYGFLLLNFGLDAIEKCNQELEYTPEKYFYDDISKKRFINIEQEKKCLEKHKNIEPIIMPEHIP